MKSSTAKKGMKYLHLLAYVPITILILLVMPVRDALVEYYRSLMEGVTAATSAYIDALKNISTYKPENETLEAPEMPNINQWDVS